MQAMNSPPQASTGANDAATLRRAIEDVARSKRTDKPLRTDVGQRFKALGASIPLAKACSRYSGLVVLDGSGPTAWIALRQGAAKPTALSSRQPTLTSDVPVSQPSDSQSDAATFRRAIEDVARSKRTDKPLRTDVGQRFKALGSSISLAMACARYSGLVDLGGSGPTAWIALRQQARATPAPLSSRQPTLISDVLASTKTVEKIIADFDASPASYAVAVDLEGERIGPDGGRLAIVSVCTPDKRVFLFDVAAMGAAAFDVGMLRVLLEHPKLPKLMFDCRADVAELHKYKVKPQSVVDLQVGAVKQLWPTSPHLLGLAKALDMMKLVCAAEARIKEAGKKLFAPEEGGSYRVFFDRPLNPIVAQYCAVDVVHLFEMRRQLAQHEALSCTVAAKRVDRSATAGFTQGRHMAVKDFA